MPIIQVVPQSAVSVDGVSSDNKMTSNPRKKLLLGCLVITIASHVAAKSREISFRLREAGQVSVAVYDAEGKMLRELSRGTRMEPGEHSLTWDGLDRYGKPAPMGEYEWRLLRTPGFTREFLVNVGTNPGWA